MATAGEPERGPRARGGNLTHEQKRLICLYERQHPKTTQAQLAQWAARRFRLGRAPSQATISFLLKRRQQFELMAGEELALKKARTVKHPAVDAALANWFLHARARGLKLPGELVRAKARAFFALLAARAPDEPKDPPQFSNGWMHSFLNRHGFSRGSRRGQDGAGEAVEAATEVKSVDDVREAIQGVAPANVFWLHQACVVPDWRPGAAADKRLTLLLCVNSDGSERVNPLVVGQEPLDMDKLPQELAQLVQYAWNRRAWLSPLLVRDWLLALDWKMRVADRHIVLFVDAIAVAPMLTISLTNVTMRGIPHGVLQEVRDPLRAGIAVALKRHYRRAFLHYALDCREEDRADIYGVSTTKAVEWIARAWQNLSLFCFMLAFMEASVLPSDAAVLLRRDVADSALQANETLDAQLQVLANRLKLPSAVPLDQLISSPDEEVEDEELTDEDYADSGLHATHGIGASADPSEVEEAARRLAESENMEPLPVTTQQQTPTLQQHPPQLHLQQATPAQLPPESIPWPQPLVQESSASALTHAELLTWSDTNQRAAVPPQVDDVVALQRVIQLSHEKQCDPSVTLALRRMLQELSEPGQAPQELPQPRPSQPAGVCRFVFARR